MRKLVNDYTDDEISHRLEFAVLIETTSSKKLLPAHLEQERQELLHEQLRRVTCKDGDGI